MQDNQNLPDKLRKLEIPKTASATASFADRLKRRTERVIVQADSAVPVVFTRDYAPVDPLSMLVNYRAVEMAAGSMEPLVLRKALYFSVATITEFSVLSGEHSQVKSEHYENQPSMQFLFPWVRVGKAKDGIGPAPHSEDAEAVVSSGRAFAAAPDSIDAKPARTASKPAARRLSGPSASVDLTSPEEPTSAVRSSSRPTAQRSRARQEEYTSEEDGSDTVVSGRRFRARKLLPLLPLLSVPVMLRYLPQLAGAHKPYALPGEAPVQTYRSMTSFLDPRSWIGLPRHQAPGNKAMQEPPVETIWARGTGKRDVIQETGPGSWGPESFGAQPARSDVSLQREGSGAQPDRSGLEKRDDSRSDKPMSPSGSVATPPSQREFPLRHLVGAAFGAYMLSNVLRSRRQDRSTRDAQEDTETPAEIQRRDIRGKRSSRLRGFSKTERGDGQLYDLKSDDYALLGQVTVISPPLHASSPEAAERGTAVAFDWASLAKGQHKLDSAGLAMLRKALPDSAQVIYPAIPKTSLPAGAANLRLSHDVVDNLLADAYSTPSRLAAQRAEKAAKDALGGTPPASHLPASIVPWKRPVSVRQSAQGQSSSASTRMATNTGSGSARRGGALGFLGLPVRVAPSLSSSTINGRTVQNMNGAGNAAAVAPAAFSSLQQRLFPAFQSVVAEPDRTAWTKAAPDYGIRETSTPAILSRIGMAGQQTPAPAPSTDRPGSIPVRLARQNPAVALTGLGPMITATPHSPAGMLQHSAVPAVVPTAGQIADPSAYPGAGRGLIIARPTIVAPLTGEAADHRLPGVAAAVPMVRMRRRGGIPGQAPVVVSTGVPYSPVYAVLPEEVISHDSEPPAGEPGRNTEGVTGSHATFPPMFRLALTHPAARDLQAHGIPRPEVRLDLPDRTDPRLDAGELIRQVKAHTSVSARAPQIIYRAPSTRTRADKSAAIQRSASGSAAPNAPATKTDKLTAPAAAAQKPVNAANEINALATEVWSLLKRRLSTEADRRGRW